MILLDQAAVDNLPNFSSSGDNGEKRFVKDVDKWWRGYTGAPAFCDSIKKQFDHTVSTDGYSAAVTIKRSLRQPVLAAPDRHPKRKRGTSDATDSTNDPNQPWVRGIDAAAIRQIASCIDPGRRSILTAVVHNSERQSRQYLQDRKPPPMSKYSSLSWSAAWWHEVSGSNERKAKTAKWLQDDPAVQAALLSTPSPKTANTQAFGQCTYSAVLLLQAMSPQAEAEEEDQASKSTAGSLQHHQPWHPQNNCGIW